MTYSKKNWILFTNFETVNSIFLTLVKESWSFIHGGPNIYLRMKKYTDRYISRPEKFGHSGFTSVPISIWGLTSETRYGRCFLTAFYIFKPQLQNAIDHGNSSLV